MKPRFTCEPGRQIYDNGKPFISIGREGETSPCDADTMARRITNMLNIAALLDVERLLDREME